MINMNVFKCLSLSDLKMLKINTELKAINIQNYFFNKIDDGKLTSTELRLNSNVELKFALINEFSLGKIFIKLHILVYLFIIFFVIVLFLHQFTSFYLVIICKFLFIHVCCTDKTLVI